MAFHPRDAFILHQEQIQRQNEGDEVDTSAEQKVHIDLQRLTDTESTATITFSHEDHTLGNPLRHVLMQNPEVTSAGYAIPHPLEAKMLLHVQSTDYAVEAVAEGLERLAVICDQTMKSFDDCMHGTSLEKIKEES
ncbi:DNA-directed RNA polymerase I/III subunit [Trypanosoma theileri]|uniref:DNA-directed RNA polymerase I/III subunit n=1 Tax=Trypanosoma theileri TaxID=67003 RepID=A0A1X0NR94_9TRYP|nr:DNA-directed RNA polymerase I/III subunit [Trypanosoma theileri]ORC87068.1 DNA-directed RNA polymerase I/III subunit [Trypanosoma theileri]